MAVQRVSCGHASAGNVSRRRIVAVRLRGHREHSPAGAEHLVAIPRRGRPRAAAPDSSAAPAGEHPLDLPLAFLLDRLLHRNPPRAPRSTKAVHPLSRGRFEQIPVLSCASAACACSLHRAKASGPRQLLANRYFLAGHTTRESANHAQVAATTVVRSFEPSGAPFHACRAIRHAGAQTWHLHSTWEGHH